MPSILTDSFEHRLAALRPAPAGVAQANFYFRAGQVSRDRRVRTWQIVTGCTVAALLATVGMFGCRLHEAETRIAEGEMKQVPAPSTVHPLEIPTVILPPSTDEDLRPYSPPMVPRATERGPTPGEIASSLELRGNILTAGMSYLDAQQKPLLR